MSRKNRFVDPEITRIELSDGDWIEIKSKLNVKEDRRMHGQGFAHIPDKAQPEGWRIEIDHVSWGLAQMEAYIVDWSFVGHDDKRIPPSRSAFEALDTETYDEITAAIDAHRDIQEREKKLSSGAGEPVLMLR